MTVLLSLAMAVPGLAAAASMNGPEAVVDSILTIVRKCHPTTETERVHVVPIDIADPDDWGEGVEIRELVAPTGPCRIGRMTYVLKLARSGRTVAKAIPVEVRRQVRGLVLTRDRIRGDELSPADVTMEWVDVTYDRGTPLTSPASLVDVSMKRSGRAGDLLHAEMIEPSPVVRRGDRVHVRYERSGFSITLDGVAWEDGRVGDPIRVKNVRSGKILTATVLEAGVVRL